MSNESITADDVLDGSAWASFCDRLKALAPEVTRDDIPGAELDRAEGVRHLTRLLSYALDVAVEFSDSDRPVFHPHPQLSYKWGGDNPDNLYQHAAVEGDKTYRIRGRRNSEHDFIIQANSCGPMEAPGAGSRRGKEVLVFSELSSQDLDIAVDGSFEIIASPEKQPGNWLPLHPDVGWINIRQYFHDWDRQRPAEFFIERVGHEGTSPAPLSAGAMADRLEAAVCWVEHGMPYWTKWVQEEHLHLPPNTTTPLGFVADGVQLITYGRGRFDLEEGQALIFECEVPKARYWHVALLNSPWFETLDYMDHQSCLNGAQIQPDADGRFRLVVSPEDPGVPNWLDSAGHLHGLVQYRWIWNETEPEPECRVVPLSELRKELPADTPRIDVEARRRDIARRREHVLRRFHLC
jgi:hypothetical protein